MRPVITRVQVVEGWHLLAEGDPQEGEHRGEEGGEGAHQGVDAACVVVLHYGDHMVGRDEEHDGARRESVRDVLRVCVCTFS